MMKPTEPTEQPVETWRYLLNIGERLVAVTTSEAASFAARRLLVPGANG